MRSILSYVLWLSTEGLSPSTSWVTEVTALFTTGIGIAGERSTSALSRRRRRSFALPPKTENPRHAGPRRAGSTVRSEAGGIRTRFTMGAKYPKSSPPANFCPSHLGGYLGRVNAAENHQDLSRRSRKMARRQASPSWLAPPSVDRAIASRAVPSGRPRASDGHANSRGANPGIRVSHPPTMGGEFKPNGSGEEALKNPSGAAAREGFARDRELSAHLRRSRSHEPRARYPTAFRRRVGMR